MADAYDAMTHDRPYRRARPAGEALDELERCAGVQFDPTVVRAFGPLARQARVLPLRRLRLPLRP